MFRLSAFAALFLAAVATAAPVPKDVKKKEPNLNGTWEMVEYHVNGNKVNSPTTTKWVIDGQSLSIERTSPKGGFIRPANITYSLVKPDGGPANALDWTYTYTNGNPSRTMPGVVEVDGDTLKFCWVNTGTGDRPTECKPTQTNLMYVFKRADPK
jgi:uncharacterized protein (TIGR03067 family)